MKLAAALGAAVRMQSADPPVRVLDRGGQSDIEDARQVVATTLEPFASSRERSRCSGACWPWG